MTGALDPYKNEYTTFTYDMYEEIASDGLIYRRDAGTLYIIGEGEAYSLSNGILELEGGGSVTIGDVDSAIVSEGVTSLAKNLLTGISLKSVTLDCNDAFDGNEVFEGDYSVMLDGGLFQPGVYVFADNVWYELSAASFSIVVSPGGGKFTRTAAPQIRMTSVVEKTDRGRLDVTVVDEQFADMQYFIGRDGEVYYLWYHFSESHIAVNVEMTSMPTVAHESIVPPSGCYEVEAWEMQIPYMEIGLGEEVTSIELVRPNMGGLRQTVIYPSWLLARDDRVRAVICAPGYGTLDLGVIQKINTTYTSKLTVLPIVCYGYSGTFCIDLGVTKTISLGYVRVSPDNPNNDSSDSRLWDNATWIGRLREFTDRWQMRTNGNRLYLKRPSVPRLDDQERPVIIVGGAFPYDPNVQYHKNDLVVINNGNGQTYICNTDNPTSNMDFTLFDPMIDYIEEIDGENCYISSAPIAYKEGRPQTISGSVELKIGTLYPKQSPPKMMQLIYRYSGAVNTGGRDMDYYFQFPVGITSRYPMLPHDWHIYTNPENKKYSVRGLHLVNGDPVAEGLTFTPDSMDTVEVFAEVDQITDGNICVITEPGEKRFRLTPIEGYTQIYLTVYMIGGGGGGGGGAFLKGYITSSIGTNISSGSGGGGGASGQYISRTRVITATDAILTVSVGSGGDGGSTGESGWNDGSTGNNGGDGTSTSVLLNGVELGPALGGLGGPGAPNTQAGGDWEDRPSPSVGSYMGGNGGGAKREYGFFGQVLASVNTSDGRYGYNAGNTEGPGYGGERTQGGSTSGEEFPGYVTYYGGGGGGGNPVIIPDTIMETSRCAGNGIGRNNNPDDRDGQYGGGGGGGSYRGKTRYYGGRGGNGIVKIIAAGATISEETQ